MKITCQSCQAKYTIADEKVAGKTVKIKCRKCGATIVVHGDTDAASAPPGSQPPESLQHPLDDDAPTQAYSGNEFPGPGAPTPSGQGTPGGADNEWAVN